jgi:hypothetical protein
VSQSVQVELRTPEELEGLRFPAALDRRLQELLDRQDRGTTLSEADREEAEALVGLAELLSVLRLRAERVPPRG